MSINVIAVNRSERLAITDTDVIGSIEAWLSGVDLVEIAKDREIAA